MRSLEDELGEALGLEVGLAAARAPLAPADLTAGERVGLARIATPERELEWLRGRAALRTLLVRDGAPAHTHGLRFPHPHYSITHCAGRALAASALDDSVLGIGVDYEEDRLLRRQTARFFLGDDELAALGHDAATAPTLLRLWTVKEALFKADPENAGRTLRGYRIATPTAWSGKGRTPSGLEQTYCTRRTRGGYLSVAITRKLPC